MVRRRDCGGHCRREVGLLGDALANVTSHALVWIQPSEPRQYDESLGGRGLTQPPLKDTMAIVLRGALVARRVERSLLRRKGVWEHAPVNPFARELHQLQVGF